MTAPQLFEYVNTGGVLAGAAVFIWALYTGRIRWGKDCDREEKRHLEEEERLEQALAASQNELSARNSVALAKLERLEKAVEERGNRL